MRRPAGMPDHMYRRFVTRMLLFVALGGVPGIVALGTYDWAINGSPWQLTTQAGTFGNWFKPGFAWHGPEILASHIGRHLVWAPPAIVLLYVMYLWTTPRVRRTPLDWTLAVTALTLGALVKVTAGLPLLLLVVWCVARAPAGHRVRTLVTHAGLAVAITAVFAAPFFNLHDPTLGILELAGHEGWLAPSRLFRRLLDAVSGDTLGGVARVAFALVLLTALIVLIRAVWRSAQRTGDERTAVQELGAAWGWALVLLMLLGPILLPWYVVWALPLVWLLPRVPRLVLLGTSVALGVSQWTAEPARFPSAYDTNVLIGHYVITPVVIALLGWLLLDGWRRWRGGLAMQDEEDESDAAGEQRDDRRADASRER